MRFMLHIKFNRFLRSVMLISFSFALLVSGCGHRSAADTSGTHKPNLIEDISQALTADTNKSSYETYTVTRTDITVSKQYKATANFPHTEEIIFPYRYENITFAESYHHYSSGNLGTFDYFEEGEPIAKFQAHIDPLLLKETQLELEKAEALYNSNRSLMENELNRLKTALDNASTPEDKITYSHEYKAALTDYNDYVTSQEAVIAQLKECCDFYSQETVYFELYAPCNGIVIFRKSQKGSPVKYGELIGTVYKLEDITFQVASIAETKFVRGELEIIYNSPNFNYGDKIQMTASRYSEYNYTGTVISAPNLLYDTSMSYVTVTLDEPEKLLSEVKLYDLFTSLAITGTYTIAKDALVIPPSAIELILDDDDNPTMTGKVTMYNNGQIYKTIVTYAYEDNNYVWITSGLNEGDVIVIN